MLSFIVDGSDNVYDHQARGVDSTQINPGDRGLWCIVLFVLCFVLVLRESANAEERYSYSSTDSTAVPSVDPQPLQPSQPMIAFAAVRKAIEYEYEYEYRCTEYEYEEIRSASARGTNYGLCPNYLRHIERSPWVRLA